MKHHLFLTTTCIFFYFSLLAQQDSTRKKSLLLTVSGSVLQSTREFVGIQPGIQYNFGNRWAILSELAFRVVKKEDSSYNQSRHIRISTEVKYFLSAKPKRGNSYVSINGIYIHRQWKDLNAGAYYLKNNNFEYTYSSAAVKSPVFAVALKFGREFPFPPNKNLTAEYFAGLGVRVIATQYDALNVQPKPYKDFQEFPYFPNALDYNQTLVKLHFTAGVRIRYAIWKE
jgi:hypothetical protein